MAKETITAFTINSLLIGLLVVGLLTSYVLLVNNEGREEIFDDYPEIEAFNLNLTETITGQNVVTAANINSNLSADYNPELAISGADQSGNAISINLQNIATAVWASLLVLGGLLFGTAFSTIATLIIAIVGFVVVAYFIKGIRTGQT